MALGLFFVPSNTRHSHFHWWCFCCRKAAGRTICGCRRERLRWPRPSPPRWPYGIFGNSGRCCPLRDAPAVAPTRELRRIHPIPIPWILAAVALAVDSFWQSRGAIPQCSPLLWIPLPDLRLHQQAGLRHIIPDLFGMLAGCLRHSGNGRLHHCRTDRRSSSSRKKGPNGESMS